MKKLNLILLIVFSLLIIELALVFTIIPGRTSGTSMLPTVHSGDFVLYSKIFDRNHIANGSIVLYVWDPDAPHMRIEDSNFINENTSMFIDHRIIGESSDAQGIFYITKGDNNSLCDPFLVRPDQIIGVEILIIRIARI